MNASLPNGQCGPQGLLETVAALLMSAGGFVSSTNYYFARHFCAARQEEIKVQMDYSLQEETTDCLVRFGVCPYCKTVFYHEDHPSDL